MITAEPENGNPTPCIKIVTPVLLPLTLNPVTSAVPLILIFPPILILPPIEALRPILISPVILVLPLTDNLYCGSFVPIPILLLFPIKIGFQIQHY